MPGTAPRFRLSRRAKGDLEGIFAYSARVWSVDQASRYILDINDAISLLAGSPHSGRRIGDIRPGYCLYRVRSHLILYQTIESGINVIRVLHGRMDIPSHL